MNKNRELILKITLSGVFLALGLLLPFLTGQIPEIGSMLCPMHIPVLICGFVCGWQYGLVVGLATPLLRSVFFGMPPMYPVAIAMSFELAAYGLICPLVYSLFLKANKKGIISIYVTLITAMILGRMVWGSARYLMSLFDNTLPFTFSIFLGGAFVTAWPGIILQLILIPTIIFALEKAKLINKNLVAD